MSSNKIGILFNDRRVAFSEKMVIIDNRRNELEVLSKPAERKFCRCCHAEA
jgi:hypothetical protein